MKWVGVLVSCLYFMFNVFPVSAGVIVGGTRLIYEGGKKEASLTVTNPDDRPYLVQSWVEPGVKGGKSPFLITPPLFRLDANSDNMLRVIMAEKKLPQDKESLFWMNIKAIPSSNNEAGHNTLQLAVNTRMKLIYRPVSLSQTPESMTERLRWEVNGGQLVVNNPTPYYMNFSEVKVDGVEIKDATFVAPCERAVFSAGGKVKSSGDVVWKLINDYGGVSGQYVFRF